MAAQELKNYLLFGVIRNSVNFPTCEVPYDGNTRVAVLHRNIPNMVSATSAVFSAAGLNIHGLANQSRGNWAYTLIDIDSGLSGRGEELMASVKRIEGVVGARIVREQQA